MLIFELTKPGSNLNYEDRELSRKFERLLSHLETAFYDANVALNLFNGESENRSALGVQNPEQWQNDFQKRQV